MTTRKATLRATLVSGFAALVLGGATVGCTVAGGGVASASDRSESRAAKAAIRTAASEAATARSALARRDAASAIRHAEGAVAAAPRSAAYRQLLGQSYLQGGRFASAAQAFADALQLSSDDGTGQDAGTGKAALNLALSQIATGDWQAARRTLATHSASIPASDRGLALSLSGDTAGGIAVLTEVARSPATSAKVRQNLALSFALSGQWASARVVAAVDVAPADVDARLEQWAAFAQPATASDQVASLLGVSAALDTGQPVALALNDLTPITPGVAEVAVASVLPSESTPAKVTSDIEKVETAAAPSSATNAGFSRVVFGPRREVAQMLPVAPRRAIISPVWVAATRQSAPGMNPGMNKASVDTPTPGNWYVQLGAFENAEVAKVAWARASRRFAVLAAHTPNGMRFKAQGEAFYRLSVGGFSRAGADAMCRRYRVAGGTCFVRMGAGDTMAHWLRQSGPEMASRS